MSGTMAHSARNTDPPHARSPSVNAVNSHRGIRDPGILFHRRSTIYAAPRAVEGLERAPGADAMGGVDESANPPLALGQRRAIDERPAKPGVERLRTEGRGRAVESALDPGEAEIGPSLFVDLVRFAGDGGQSGELPVHGTWVA
jgi:hypothetical protein